MSKAKTAPARTDAGARKHRKWPWIVLAVILVVCIALIAVGNYLVSFGVGRSVESGDVSPDSVTAEEDASAIDENMEWIEAQRDAWLETADMETVSIVSDDGLTLVGDIIRTEEESRLWVITVHGYSGNRTNTYTVASFFALEGYNVLTPDLRGNGDSEGDYFGMGWLDRADLLLWIDYIIGLDADAEIVLYGASMGGATVMMTAGEALPENVKAVVEDCGYTSVWDIFSDELDYLFGLPDFPLLYIADVLCDIRAGYSFHEASSLEQVANAEVPILFIHGSEDNFVATDMVYELYDACPTEKDLLIVEGAGHNESYKLEPELYFDTVFSFLEKYVSPD